MWIIDYEIITNNEMVGNGITETFTTKENFNIRLTELKNTNNVEITNIYTR